MQAIDLQQAARVITTPLPVIHDTRTPVTTTGKTTLWDRIAIAVRAKGYSLSTERTYVHWAKRFVAWHGKRHPSTMGAAEVQAYLNHLAVDENSAPSTCKQALCATRRWSRWRAALLGRGLGAVGWPWVIAATPAPARAAAPRMRCRRGRFRCPRSVQPHG